VKKADYIYYMDLAKRAARNSMAVRLKVGAILVRDRCILADAWNGTPPGWDNCCEEEINGVLVTKPTVLHAEKNILRKMANSHNIIRGASLIMTHNPCPPCAADYIGLGLSELIYETPYRISDGLDVLRQDGVIVRTFDEVMKSFE
jgi:dCMP deaminase